MSARSEPEVATPGITLVDLLVLGAPGGKTELLGGVVHRVFVAKSPEDARRCFESLAREVCLAAALPWQEELVEGRDSFERGRLSLVVTGPTIELGVRVSYEVWTAFSD